MNSHYPPERVCGARARARYLRQRHWFRLYPPSARLIEARARNQEAHLRAQKLRG